MRYLIVVLLFIQIPRVMVHRLIKIVIRNLNHFLAENGVSVEYSLSNIVTSRPSTDFSEMLLDFRSYIEVYEDISWVASSNRFFSTPAMCLGLPSSRNPRHYFMSLMRGRRLRRLQ